MDAARPLIGIGLNYQRGDDTCYRQRHYYAAAVEQGGGLPVLLPFHTDLSMAAELVQRLDGLLLSGGDDLDPAAYGEQRHPKADHSSPCRQQFDLAVAAAAEQRRVPLLGICLGCQVMNVHCGGSLSQFLPDHSREGAVEHRPEAAGAWPEHPVRQEGASLLAQAVERSEMMVNSSHKQAVSKVGRHLRVCAVARDGVIEGIEDPALPLFLGVQWHPERLCDRPELQLLVQKAAAYRSTFKEQPIFSQAEYSRVAEAGGMQYSAVGDCALTTPRERIEAVGRM